MWAHMGWVMVDQGEEIVEHVEDLQEDKILAWQDRHIFLIGFLVGIVLPGVVGFLAIGGMHGFLGGMIYGGFLRVVVVHHATFLINSAAHTWGTQPYSTANTSRDSPVLSFFTFGEGYHNFHHTFQADYRKRPQVVPLGSIKMVDQGRILDWNDQRFASNPKEIDRVPANENDLRKKVRRG